MSYCTCVQCHWPESAVGKLWLCSQTFFISGAGFAIRLIRRYTYFHLFHLVILAFNHLTDPFWICLNTPVPQLELYYKPMILYSDSRMYSHVLGVTGLTQHCRAPARPCDTSPGLPALCSAPDSQSL